MKKVNILNIHQFHDGESPEDFYANTLENHLQTRHKDINIPHKHNFYLTVLFTKGSGIHEVDFTSYKVKPGTMFFLNPGQTHHWELSADTRGYILFHTQAFYDLHYTHTKLNKFPFYYSVHNTPVLQIGEQEKLVGLFKFIVEENTVAKPYQREAIASLLDMIYIEAARIYPAQSNGGTEFENNYYTKYRQFEELVGQQFSNERSPSVYASMLNISAKHLNRISQSVVGKTAGDVILERVLLEAKRELVLQQNSFAQIAHLLGYEDYAYFSRLFKKKTGETPSSFISRYRKTA